MSTGSSWFVRNLNYSSGSKWVTQVGENKDRDKGGWGIGLARDGDSFQVGIDSFDTVTSLGPATRTSGAEMRHPLNGFRADPLDSNQLNPTF